LAAKRSVRRKTSGVCKKDLKQRYRIFHTTGKDFIFREGSSFKGKMFLKTFSLKDEGWSNLYLLISKYSSTSSSQGVGGNMGSECI
jgi:hypothetical protein